MPLLCKEVPRPLAQVQLRQGPLGPAQTPTQPKEQGSAATSGSGPVPGRRTGSGGNHPTVGGQASWGDHQRHQPPLQDWSQANREDLVSSANSRCWVLLRLWAALAVRKGQRIRVDTNSVLGRESSYSAHVLSSPKLYLPMLFQGYLCNRQR